MYGEEPWYGVSIVEFDGPRIARMTDYFGPAFPAPAWRAQWVELRERDDVVPAGGCRRLARRAPPPDLAAPLPDPDVEPLPGDRLRDERRVGDARAVDGDPAAADQPPSLSLGRDQPGLGQDDRGRPPPVPPRSNVNPPADS